MPEALDGAFEVAQRLFGVEALLGAGARIGAGGGENGGGIRVR